MTLAMKKLQVVRWIAAALTLGLATQLIPSALAQEATNDQIPAAVVAVVVAWRSDWEGRRAQRAYWVLVGLACVGTLALFGYLRFLGWPA